ncbi:MAG: hypothetical protein JW780_06320 [Clostridiales bacterium]|nr:hypothetical protein [Clostridiales bacterium]
MKKKKSALNSERPEEKDDSRPVRRPGNAVLSDSSEMSAEDASAADAPVPDEDTTAADMRNEDTTSADASDEGGLSSGSESDANDRSGDPSATAGSDPDQVDPDTDEMSASGSAVRESDEVTKDKAPEAVSASDAEDDTELENKDVYAESLEEVYTDPLSDVKPTLSFASDEPTLFRRSDELVFPESAEDDPDIPEYSSVRVSSDTTVFEPRIRKLSWLKPRHIITPFVAIAVVLFFVFVIIVEDKNERAASPLMIRGNAVSNAEFSFMYHYILLENGIDILSESSRDLLGSPMDNGYDTYRDYFLDITAKEMQTTAILYDDAVANGYTVNQTHINRARNYLEWLNDQAMSLSVDLETYIKGAFGKSVDSELILDVLSRKYFVDEYAEGPKLEELCATEDQAEEAYLSAPNQYDVISYRLLRIVFEQKEPSFIATAHLHAREIIEKIEHDQSQFEIVAAEYFSGDAKERLLKPDSTLISDVRFNDIDDMEWRVWLFDPQRTPGDCIIYEDDDGFPILICFSSRTRQIEPLRDVRMIFLYEEDPENNVPGIPKSDIASQALTVLNSITDEASVQNLERTYSEDIALGKVSVSHSSDTYKGKLDPLFDEWIFDPARKPGDKTSITTEEGIAVIYYVESSENPEWFDRVNSFIRINNFQEFLLAKQEEYPYRFSDEGLKSI